MKCPVCKTTELLMAERRSIEIDYCPVCRGVWLDRGELDKLIALERQEADTAAPSRAHQDYPRDRPDEGRHPYPDSRPGYPQQKKKRSIFDVFDFD